METIAGAVRLKAVRAEAIVRGRATVRLFEQFGPGERPHPRLQLSFTEIDDPAPPSLPTLPAWADVAELRAWLAAALADPGLVPDPRQAPAASPRYWMNALRAARVTALLDHAEAGIAARDGWTEAERVQARYALAELGELAFTGTLAFDDEDTGTYHSFLHDEPFVHVFETLLAGLPGEASEAFALLPAEQQYAVRRQRAQLQNHLDVLMRHKYAYAGIHETDIERSLGGRLIDRETRQIASEDPATSGLIGPRRALASLRPRHQLLRIDPASEHPHAGAWLHRTPAGLALADGTALALDQAAEDALVQAIPLAPERLTFARAPGDPRLRPGVRFDWNGDGSIDGAPIPWLSWAGHCDIKAVLEALGLALLDQPSVFEYRSDTAELTELTRALQLELLTGVVELGSVYRRLDGFGSIVRGIHRFGGARNDSLPDRLQFDGAAAGRSFRWPLSRERAALRVTGLTVDGEALDPDHAVARCHPDLAALDFAANPRYLGTVDGDYHLIDASGMIVEAEIRVSSFDASGQLRHSTTATRIDLRPKTDRGASGRSLLGTEVVRQPRDPAANSGGRELHRVYLDHDQPAIVIELWRWDPSTGSEQHDPSGDRTIALADPLATTLSREQRLDDPASFEALIELALRRGQNICADTDDQAPVWNGVVTAIHVERVAANPSARVERWRVGFDARFGRATLDYLVRRAPDGRPVEYCPISGGYERSPDFLWQDLPDIASKALADGAWVVNQTMLERGLVELHWEPEAEGGWYVDDDHIKNAFELVYAGLAGFRWTIVHQNKRYGFTDEAAWTAARARLERLRGALKFE